MQFHQLIYSAGLKENEYIYEKNYLCIFIFAIENTIWKFNLQILIYLSYDFHIHLVYEKYRSLHKLCVIKGAKRSL